MDFGPTRPAQERAVRDLQMASIGSPHSKLGVSWERGKAQSRKPSRPVASEATE